jgi:hypothetical protein
MKGDSALYSTCKFQDLLWKGVCLAAASRWFRHVPVNFLCDGLRNLTIACALWCSSRQLAGHVPAFEHSMPRPWLEGALAPSLNAVAIV